MSLQSGDLTTPARVAAWVNQPGLANNPGVAQMITSMTTLIYNKLNRARLFSQQFVRTLDGVGNYQLVLPDWPVTKITKVQMGAAIVNPSPLPDPTTGVIPPPNFGYGYRFVPWSGNLPGDAVVLEFVNGFWYPGAQNIKVTYTAGYLISDEPGTIPTSGTPNITVIQPQGIWCRDNGVTFADGTPLTPVSAITGSGQYIPPTDTDLGLYQFSPVDGGKEVLISYSFVPADLEEACIQMVMERRSYTGRIGELDKTLGGQETVRFLRGGLGRSAFHDIPPEVEGLIWPYVSVIPPSIGAPV